MKQVESYNDIYEVQFEQLVEGEKTPLDSSADIFKAQMEVTVSMGSSREKIRNIVNYKVGDLIILDKHVEETLDINVNGQMIASGESIIIDNKLGVRLSQIKNISDEN